MHIHPLFKRFLDRRFPRTREGLAVSRIVSFQNDLELVAQRLSRNGIKVCVRLHPEKEYADLYVPNTFILMRVIVRGKGEIPRQLVVMYTPHLHNAVMEAWKILENRLPGRVRFFLSDFLRPI